MKISKLRIIITDSNNSPFNFIELDKFDNEFYDDKVVLYSKNYEKIFGKMLKESNYKPWKKGIVKIINKDKNVKLFRIFFGAPLNKDEFGLNLYNKHLLSLESDENLNVEFKKSGRLPFYWNHPNHSVRSAFKLGIVSVIISIISLFLGIVSLL